MIEDIVCSRWTLIDALARHKMPILINVPRMRSLALLPSGEGTGIFKDEVTVDVTPYIIKIIQEEGKEIRALQEELYKYKQEFYEYKKEHREFEQFKKWKGRY